MEHKREWDVRVILLLIASSRMAVAGGCRRAGDPGEQVRALVASPLPRLSAETLRRIEAVERRADIVALMVRQGVPGMSVALVREGRLEWSCGYVVATVGEGEPVTPETLFQAASISKSVSAAAALRLVAEGKLALEGM